MGKYVLRIIKEEEKLSERCSEVNVFENLKDVSKIVSDLKDTLKANKDLMALAAPQLGYKERIFCIRFSDGTIQAFVNPMITKTQGKALMIEKDIIDDKEYMTPRPDRIMVAYQDVNGKVSSDIALNFPVSATFAYMVDVIDGTFHIKHQEVGLDIDDNYYKAPQEQKDALHNWYWETFLPTKIGKLQAEEDSDPEIKKIHDAIKFMTSVISGETELVPEVDGELDFEHSSKKNIEKDNQKQKAFEDKLKKKFGIE